MPTHGKRFRQAQAAVTQPAYPLRGAVELLKAMPQTKFDQSVELHLKLGIDPKQSDQNLRGAINLPAGLVLYFFVSNLLSIAQQLYMNKFVKD